MGMYEIYKKRYDEAVALFEKNSGLLTQYLGLKVIERDPLTIAKYDMVIEKLQGQDSELETQVTTVESKVQQYATTPEKLFIPPVKIYIGGDGNGYTNPKPTMPGVETEGTFDTTNFGDVSVEANELESLLIERSQYVEPVPFMNGLKKAIMGVGRVELNGEAFGTAFLVDKNRVLTNWHVVRDPKYLDSLTVRFGHFFSDEKTLEPGKVFKVAKLIAWSEEKTLDYGLLELQTDPTSEGEFNALTASPNLPNENRVVNILHHPKGVPLKLSTQDNWVKKVKGDRVLYLTGTEPGSSGAPVFNDQWQLVALHHSGKPFPATNFPGTVDANEGIVMKTILDDLASKQVVLP